MPRKKNWRKGESRRAVLRHTEETEGQGNLSEANSEPHGESTAKYAQSPVSVQAQSPVSVQAQSPVSVQAHIPVSVQAQSPVSVQAQSPVSMQARNSANEKLHGKRHTQSKFIKIQPKNLVQMSLENSYETNVSCSEVVFRSVILSWNACHIIFGSFHQNDARFSEKSRGFQCTGNALCMLSYSTCLEINNSLALDKILCDGDTLYQSIINSLKADGTFIHALLSLDEVPNVFEVSIEKFTVEKQPIVSGILVDTHKDHGLPTLHCVLQSCFAIASSGLLTIGAICSAVFKNNSLYM